MQKKFIDLAIEIYGHSLARIFYDTYQSIKKAEQAYKLYKRTGKLPKEVQKKIREIIKTRL